MKLVIHLCQFLQLAMFSLIQDLLDNRRELSHSLSPLSMPPALHPLLRTSTPRVLQAPFSSASGQTSTVFRSFTSSLIPQAQYIFSKVYDLPCGHSEPTTLLQPCESLLWGLLLVANTRLFVRRTRVLLPGHSLEHSATQEHWAVSSVPCCAKLQQRWQRNFVMHMVEKHC